MSTSTLVTPYCAHPAQVRRVHQLGDNFRRFTFTGPTMDRFDSGGYDQRIKLILPLDGLGMAPLPGGPDWYLRWRELPDEMRNPIRTYTVRAVRPELAEVDVDIALHGRLGPAGRWAIDARAGDEIVIFGPDAAHGGPYGGIDFLPPAHSDRLLLAGDPTALPAIAAILEQLPADARGIALVEVEAAADAAALGGAPSGMTVQVLVRQPGEHGSQLIPAVQRAADTLLPTRPESPVDIEDVDVDTGLLWEAPRDEFDHPARDSTSLYAWLAGEACVIKTLRRHLVSERGLDRRSVAFMGYWRLGRQEGN